MRLLILGALVAVLAEGECDPAVQHQRAELNYKAFLGRMYPATSGFAVINAECTNSDSDNDGYVSCNATLRDSDAGHGALIHDVSECGYYDQGNAGGRPSGCRAPKTSRSSG